MRKLNTGEIVRLKSGGPEMTVYDYKTYPNISGPSTKSTTIVICEWFDSSGKIQKKDFHHDMLDILEK